MEEVQDLEECQEESRKARWKGIVGNKRFRSRIGKKNARIEVG